jgi:hypothetical protein
MPHVPDRDGIREQLAATLGPNTYNRLVESVPDTRRRGRLRFWQEELLCRAGPVGPPLATAEEFLRVFDRATVLSVPSEPLTREVYLREVEQWPYAIFSPGVTPAEWAATAWEINRVREELSGEMARTVSKCGELAYTGEYLRFLSESLSVPRQVELYLHIRGRCVTREPEFRPGFERSFPACVPLLPPSLTRQQLLDVLGLAEEEYHRQTAGLAQFGPDSVGPDPGAGGEIPF